MGAASGAKVGWRLVWLALVWLLWLRAFSPLPAHADDAVSDPDAAYQEQIRRAVQEYELGHWNEAKAFFAQAHAMQPSARTLRGLGLASYELRDYVAAIGYGTEALASTVRPLTEEMSKELRTTLDQSQRFVCHVQLVLEPKSATLRVDGKSPTIGADGRLLLNPGPHELVAEASGFEPVTRTLQAQGGDSLQLDLTLHPAGSGAAAAEAVSGDSASSPQSSRRDGSIMPWVVVGASGAVAVTGVVLFALSLSDVSSVENARVGSNWSDVKSANDRAPTLSAAGLVLIGAGVAGVAAGLAWKLWPQTAEHDASASATLHLAPGAVRLTGSF